MAVPSIITQQSIFRIIAVVSAVVTFFGLDHLIDIRHRFKASPFDINAVDTDTIPQNIYQTWMSPANHLAAPYQAWSQSWSIKNPAYRYELITDEAQFYYVKSRYHTEKTIVNTFNKITDNILRADYLRYLVLLADGGVYTDMDTVCVRPIDDWVAPEFRESAKLVVGLEWDSLGADISQRTDFLFPIQFSQWTLMSAPGHPFMRSIVDQVTVNLQRLGEGLDAIRAMSKDEVLKTTGPMVFTRGLMAELSRQAGREVDFSELSAMHEPKLYGDVLILPINSFATGVPHSNASLYSNPQQLIEHHFAGFQTWKMTHSK